MDVEVIALTATLGISVVGNIGAWLVRQGVTNSKLDELSEDLKSIKTDLKEFEIDNQSAHKTIYSTQEFIGKSVVKTEEHLKNLNGSVERNSRSIDTCKTAIEKNTERIFTHTHQKHD